VSRKDFIALAEVLAAELSIRRDQPEAEDAVRCVILSTADVCKRSNSNFKRDKFYQACGLDANGSLR
jgi:hypothetical protein